MRKDQYLRGLGIVVVTVGFVVRLLTVGNGPFSIFGYEMTPFAAFLVVVVMLALPETIEMLPFGPSRKG